MSDLTIDRLKEARKQKGLVIRAHRKKKKLSGYALAALTGLTSTTIYRIEKGGQGLGKESAQAIARELGMDLNFLLAEAG